MRDLSTFLLVIVVLFILARYLVERYVRWKDWNTWYEYWYLNSLHWHWLRWWKKMSFRIAHHGRLYCEKCMRDNRLQIHHVTYKRLGHERLSDLQVVCFRCHRQGSGRI